MYCERCGSKVYDNEKFCQKCGTKIKRFKSPESMKIRPAVQISKETAAPSGKEVKTVKPDPAAEEEKAAGTVQPEEVKTSAEDTLDSGALKSGEIKEEAAQENGDVKKEENIPEDPSESGTAEMKEDVPEDPSESGTAEMKKDVPEVSPESDVTGAKEDVPEDLSENSPAGAEESVSEVLPESEADGAKEDVPETKPENISDEAEESIPEAVPESDIPEIKEDILKEETAKKPEAAQAGAFSAENEALNSGKETPVIPAEENKENKTAAEKRYSEKGRKMSEEKETGKENKKTEKKENGKDTSEVNKKERKDNKKTEDKSKEKAKAKADKTASGSLKAQPEASEKKKKNIQSSYPVIEAARQALGSPFVLLGTAALGVQIVLMLVYAFSADAAYAVNFMSRLFFYHEKGMLFFRMAVIAIAVTEAFMFSGFLISWISARRKKKPFKTAGLSILQVLCVIGLIAVCFAGLCAIGALLVLIRYLRHYTYISLEGVSTGQIVYVVCMAAALIAVYILVLIFFTKLVSSIGRAKRAAAGGTARKNIALYNAVMLIVIAFCIVAFSVASLLTSAPSTFMIILAELCLALACVLYAAFMIIYRTKMKRLL